jgi:hypothetical protein
MTKLKPSVKLALAYVYVTSWMPMHIRVDTYMDVIDHTNSVAGIRTVKPESLDLIKDHPYVIADEWLRKQGFYPTTTRSTTHYISYKHEDGRTATTYRHGGYITMVPVSGMWAERSIVNLKDIT